MTPFVLFVCGENVQVLHPGHRMANAHHDDGLRRGLSAGQTGETDLRAQYGVYLQLAGVGEAKETGTTPSKVKPHRIGLQSGVV